MKYAFIGCLTALFFSASAFGFAANGAEVSGDDASGALADRFIELHRREAEMHAQRQEPRKETQTAQDLQEIEWQKKLDALSHKLRLARKTFKSASSEAFDFALAPLSQARPAE